VSRGGGAGGGWFGVTPASLDGEHGHVGIIDRRSAVVLAAYVYRRDQREDDEKIYRSRALDTAVPFSDSLASRPSSIRSKPLPKDFNFLRQTCLIWYNLF
jgi:hypothetical protein